MKGFGIMNRTQGKFRGSAGRVTYEAERLVMRINEQIVERMEAQNVTRTELANRLNVNKAYVTRMLNGTPNMTLKTLASVGVALKCRFSVPELRELADFEQPPCELDQTADRTEAAVPPLAFCRQPAPLSSRADEVFRPVRAEPIVTVAPKEIARDEYSAAAA